MFRGLATVNFWADDLLAAKQWHAEIFGIDAYSVVDPFGNILGIMTNPHYLAILASIKSTA